MRGKHLAGCGCSSIFSGDTETQRPSLLFGKVTKHSWTVETLTVSVRQLLPRPSLSDYLLRR